MSKNKRQQRNQGRERRVSVRAVRRDPPDLKKLSQALIALAMAQAEKDAQATHESESSQGDKRRSA